MLLAKTSAGLLKATPNTVGICPSCGSKVISKCGTVNIWHWAHEQDSDCDLWSEPETEWHYNWKIQFPVECIEVVIKNSEMPNVKHRADVFWLGRVIEFQHSSISEDDILSRELFYKNMIWVIDATEFKYNLYFNNNNNYCRWKWLRKCWKSASKPLFLQLGNLVMRITKWTYKGFYYEEISVIDFKKKYLNLRFCPVVSDDEVTGQREDADAAFK